MKIKALLLSLLLLALPVSVAVAQTMPNGGGGGGSSCTFANPTATASDTAVNGVATTCMRSDAAPAVQKGSSSQFGVVKVDGTTITAASGVISATGNVAGPASATADNFASYNGTTGKIIKDSGKSASSFSPAGEVNLVNGSDPTITATDWAAFAQYTVIGSGRTLTIPASSGLSTNGGLAIDANAAAVTLTANAADTITFNGSTGSAGGSVTLPQGGLYFLSTDGAGKLYVSGRTVQGNGAKVQLSTGSTTNGHCVQYDANGNTIDAGSACGGGSGGLSPAYYTGNWYWALNAPLSTGAAPAIGKVYFTPLSVGQNITVTDLGADIATSGTGNFQEAIYASDPTTGLPTGAPLSSTSNITTGSTFGQTGALGSPVALSASGHYWIGAMADNTTVRFASVTVGSTSAAFMGGTNLSGIGAGLTSYLGPTATFGTWPTMNGTACGTGNCTTVAGSSSGLPTPVPVFKVQ